MAEIINLRQQRKAQARRLLEQKAAENRALHGLGKGEKRRQKLEADQARALIDGHKLERDEP